MLYWQHFAKVYKKASPHRNHFERDSKIWRTNLLLILPLLPQLLEPRLQVPQLLPL